MNRTTLYFLSAAGFALGLSACVHTAATGPNATAAPSSVAAPTGYAWFDAAQKTLSERKAIMANTAPARNVILFVADGMGPTTVAATRIYDGQTRGEDGEENLLSFERFPHLAMSKTYNTDAQTPDSAGTMTAMATGYKTKAGVISLTDAAERGDCATSLTSKAPTILELAETKGMATGVVSTARLTHATPAATYAHSPERGWEADTNLPDGAFATGCRDIASQLIDFSYGDGVDVAMGGGRLNFLPATIADPENKKEKGARKDGRNLVDEWVAKSDSHVAVWNKDGFDALEPTATPRVLGLFEPSHMKYEADRTKDKGGEPSLEEMTRKAIEILSQDQNGFLLVVEAGRVDHAHHGGNAARALHDAQEFSQAVAAAQEMTNSAQTLIIATADHAHTLSFAGYPRKGNNILGLVNTAPGRDDDRDPATIDHWARAGDGKPYTTLGYINGPGSVFRNGVDLGEGRPELTSEEAEHLDHRQQALAPTGSETHGGQDVTIYAVGPNAYLFGGVVEQNYIFHVIDDALGLTP